MPPERWRCFVAIPIGEALRRDLAAGVRLWRGRADLANLRWSGPDSWHVTLAFLGLVDASRIPDLVSSVGSVAARSGPMRLTTGGVGGFPSTSRARVAWYGIADPAGSLSRLAHDLGAALGIEGDRPFRPHVTVARARHEPVDLRAWKAEAGAPEAVIAVDRLDLMRSHLGRGPARYETLSTSSLGVPAGV